MSLLNHGLSALMEACRQSENAEVSNESLFESFDEKIDDDVKACLTGDDPDDDVLDDSVESDMAGNGIGTDDEKMEKLLNKIPPSDEGIEEDIESLAESVIPSDELDYVY